MAAGVGYTLGFHAEGSGFGLTLAQASFTCYK